ncbi:MAG: UDP-N-acetylglucosamine 1-carboxyvinyltransferase [Patescibacteria group bacterium]|nr:UDP-N-acetylglucosamine 1-carboxyvinyltransferase [Patescibacteria group bacterium]MDE2218460.1 UDP-N-acetylglucosamine 1-carboxyvinyltransferase [Patescibacteria group bacterium]
MNKKLAHIGRLIQRLRTERGITQGRFAEKLCTSQSVIARIENGEQNLSTVMLSKISDALEQDIVNVSDGAINIQIEGGAKLSGSVRTKTSKNGAVGLLCASLLNKNKTILKNVPKIEEVYRIIEVLESVGVSAKWNGNDLIIAPPKKISLSKINKESAIKTRSVIMMIGPLMHLFKSFELPQAGGCKLGSRTVRPHFFALEKLGVDIKAKSDRYEILVNKLKPADITLYESGDTVTENAIMAAAKIPGKTVIKFASANYQVQDLCFFMEKLGVRIEGVGTTTLTVHGKEEIDVPVAYYLSEDPIESMFFISAAILTNSSIAIERCPIDFMEIELLKLEKMGFKYKILKRYKSENEKTNLADIKTYPSKLTALDDKIESRPYPGLNIDNLPYFAVIATQAKGKTLIHDWVYEKRATYYAELDKLGAETLLADPHRVYITGPTKLRANEVVCPSALRPAAIILIGMLGARGISILRNIYSINRGYEDIIRRLNGLGAKIKILREV